jgi:hypothetical protein
MVCRGNVPAGCLGRGLEYEYGDDDSRDAGREPTFEEAKKQMFGSRPRGEPKKGTCYSQARFVVDGSRFIRVSMKPEACLPHSLQ